MHPITIRLRDALEAHRRAQEAGAFDQILSENGDHPTAKAHIQEYRRLEDVAKNAFGALLSAIKTGDYRGEGTYRQAVLDAARGMSKARRRVLLEVSTPLARSHPPAIPPRNVSSTCPDAKRGCYRHCALFKDGRASKDYCPKRGRVK
jgi:hypothetical protein